MPHAASITPPSAPASPALLAPGGANSTHGQGALAGREFGELFREQAGTKLVPVQPPLRATERSSVEMSPSTPSPKTQAAPVAKNTEPPVAEPARDEQRLTGPEEPGSANATLGSSAPSPSHASFQSESRPAGGNEASVPEAGATPPKTESGLRKAEANPPKTLPEAATPALPTPSSAVESNIKPKKTNSASSATTPAPRHRTKEDAQVSRQTPPPSSAAQQSALPIVPGVASAEKFFVTSPIAEQPVPKPGQVQSIRSANGQGSTIAKGTPSRTEFAEANGASPQTAETQQPAGGKPAPSSGVTPPSAIDSSQSTAPSRNLSPSTSPLFHGSLVSHAVHTTEQGTGGALAAAASCAAVEAHPAEAAASTPAPSPAATAINPTTTTVVIAAANPAPSPYDRIDQGAAPVVLHSGAQHVAVGVRDPSLGWVEIQTQNVAGHVDAILVTASGQTHASLAAQLPAMADYLEQRDVRVGTLAVHHQTPGTNDSNAPGNNPGDGSGYGPGYGSGSGSGGGGGARKFDQTGSGTYSGQGRPQYNGVSPGLETGAIVGDEGPTFQPISYISVRA